MKVVLTTPLYPPEIAEPAPYVKELAKRLAKLHEVTVVAYAHLPEEVHGVTMVTIDKRRPLLLRLPVFLWEFARFTRKADVVYAMNGPSVELPALLVSFVSLTPFIFIIADIAAHERASRHFFSRILERLAFARARTLVHKLPFPRPEIFPLEPHPTEAFAAYEASWDAHLKELQSLPTMYE